MTILDTLNFVAFNPLQNNNLIAVRRRKLIAKIDKQIQLKANKNCTLTQHKWAAEVLPKVRDAAENGELDALIDKQAQFGRRVTQKNK